MKGLVIFLAKTKVDTAKPVSYPRPIFVLSVNTTGSTPFAFGV